MQYTFEAIGTQWQVDFEFPISEVRSARLLAKIKDRIEVFDKNYSRFRSDSLVTKMAQKAGQYTLPSDAEPLFSLYKKLYDLTSGLFTPLIGQLLVESGYDEKYSLSKSEKINQVPHWEEVAEYRGTELLLHQPTLLDFGAAGKGYLVDLISQLLEAEGITNYCVDGSGDIFYKNAENKKLRVGLENPQNTSEVIGFVEVCNQSICGSATNRRKWGNYHHIMNPTTLHSVQDIQATWVVADSALLADSLATCLFFVKPDVLLADYNFEYVVIKNDMSIEHSAHLSGELFYQ